LKPASFEYHVADTVDDAVQLLDELSDEDPKILAGGQSLVPMMNFRLATPGHIVDINRVKGLSSVERENDQLIVGALVRHADIEDSAFLRETFPLLPRVATEIGYRQIRNRGTVGGSICHADPAAEWPLVMRVLEASFDVASPAGTRRIDANEFFTYYFSNLLESNEMLTSVRFSLPGTGSGWGFREFARKAGDFAIVATGAVVEASDGAISAARIALGGVGSVPIRSSEAETMVAGVALDDSDARRQAAQTAADSCDPTDDAHGSAWYRRQLVRVQVERVLEEACAMARDAA
jgi:carbon-monoxide dehydrogenase medium subunit